MEGTLALSDREQWAQEQFGGADLGDRRRTQRLVKVASQMAHSSSGSIPQQTGGGADMKAAYRLFAAEDVTHEAVCTPHWQRTRTLAAELPRTYIVSDFCVLSYTSHVKTKGLGPIQDEDQLGLHQLNMLAINPDTKRPIGLMHQHLYRRILRPDDKTRESRRKRDLVERESYWWIEGIQAVGIAPRGCLWVHVIDRGGDMFEVYAVTQETQTSFIIRAAQDRLIERTQEGHTHLFDYARLQPMLATRKVIVRKKDETQRQAVVHVSAGRVTIHPPANEPELRDRAPIQCWVVRAWEPNPPKGVEPLEWILMTMLPVETPAQAVEVVDGYSMRWMVEEFHKVEKTGCIVEDRQLTHTDRLEPLIGLLSVLSVYLLQLKYVARDAPDTPASDLFDEETTCLMAAYLKRMTAGMTVGQFWRGIGRLGGHPGRKGDGPVGWLRAWRGWQAFQLMLLGATLRATTAGQRCG